MRVDVITEAGLRKIGALPDPQQQFMEGLEAAIQALREDDTLTHAEKKRSIDWLEEGKLLARTLTSESIKAIVRGDLA